MSFKTKINWKEEKERLEDLTTAGFSMVQIAKKYGVSKQRIKQVFSQLGITSIGLKRKKEEKLQAWALKWGEKNASDLYQSQRSKYRTKRANSLHQGVEFTVLFGELDWPVYCPVLGIEIDYFAETRQENSPSFDRMDPSKGYVKGNVQIVSWRANRIKNDGTAEEHRKIAEYMMKI